MTWNLIMLSPLFRESLIILFFILAPTTSERMSLTLSLTNHKCIKTDNCSFTDAKEIPEIFNDHFTEIGPELASGIPERPISCSDYITQV